MTDPIAPDYLDRSGRPRLAYRHAAGRGPTIVFLPGYMSDMAGGKATALFDWAATEGQACLLLDYAGCGQSDGQFADQTLLDWRGDVLDLIDAKTEGPVLIVGSSMGGWLMLLTALAAWLWLGRYRWTALLPLLAGLLVKLSALLALTTFGLTAIKPHLRIRPLTVMGLGALLLLLAVVTLRWLHLDGQAPIRLGEREGVFLLRDIPHRLSPEADDTHCRPCDMLPMRPAIALPV